MNYYNENDRKAAAWLRELIKAKLIPQGEVDERSIRDVSATDVRGFRQCHFFAGIAGWPLALRLAGVSEDKEIWTGSCPCQPFSCAGKGQVDTDERHLWPVFRELIAQCRPATVFGEQVASKDGRIWLTRVCADLEDMGYGCAAADLCAASVGAPHIRQRLFWVADAQGNRNRNRQERTGMAVAGIDSPDRMADAARGGFGIDMGAPQPTRHTEQCGEFIRVDDADGPGPQGRGLQLGRHTQQRTPWETGFEVVRCTDGKARRFESGSFPLVARIPKGMVRGGDSGLPINPQATAEARIMRLRGYGNSIVPVLAAEFIGAYLDTLSGGR